MFTTIVWATDGSENAARALPYAKALATGEGAMLVAVHIVHHPEGGNADLSSQPAQGTADIAEEVGADVIVLGTRGHSAITGLLVGSVTQRLLPSAPCPVLSVGPVTRRDRKAPNSNRRNLSPAKH